MGQGGLMKVNWVAVITYTVSIAAMLWASIHLLDVMYDYYWNVH